MDKKVRVMAKITIDNRVVEAEPGSTILDAATKGGIYIPTLCYHESLSPGGSCRICVVEIATNGKSELTVACSYSVAEGLQVKTSSARITEARKLAIELLLAQHPHSQKIRELAEKLAIEKPSFTLAAEECILCGLCVRTCHEIVGADAISFIAQGLARDIEQPFVEHSETKCIGCDACAYVCPTEAITVKDVGDTRTLATPGGRIEFKLKQCKTCGSYWAPEKQLEYIAKQSNIAPEIFDVCLTCRD